MDLPETLPCLSVLQPYSWLIVNGFKDLENRTWPTSFRGRILIHAGKTYTRRTHDSYAEQLADLDIMLPPFEQMQVGGIVGSVTLADCVRQHPSPWKTPDSFGFVLSRPRVRDFVPYRGETGIFPVPSKVLNQLEKLHA